MAQYLIFDGDATRTARKSQGLGLHRLAILLSKRGDGVTAETIRKWELGVTEPRASMLYELARVLKRTPLSLMRPRPS